MSDIIFEQRGVVGLITLNRVKALNALSHDMIMQLAKQLELWRNDDTIASVILTSNSDRAFCAGADIRAVHAGRDNPNFNFFIDEYRLNAAIHSYPKPYISLIDGIVMGGGVGLSFHGQYVVAAKNTLFAMPEVGIGLFPDIGACYHLSRMDGALGTYCATTGWRLRRGDLLAAGLVTHAIETDHFAQIIQSLSDGEDVEAVLSSFHVDGPSELGADILNEIRSAFSAQSVAEILEKLGASDHPFAKETLELMHSRSPLSVHIAFEQIHRAADLSFEECLQMDYRIVRRMLLDGDFYEGVRATIIDKDGTPHWEPSSFEAVKQEQIDRHFAPLGAQELVFHTR